LPEIRWNEDSPGFYVIKVDHLGTLEMLQPILPADFIYEALSFMGCSCGLAYGEGLENPAQRVKDVRDFADYLDTHKQENELLIFSTMWNEFPDDYEHKDFKISSIDSDEFYMEEMVILTVV
jgi:hypothetical protein